MARDVEVRLKFTQTGVEIVSATAKSLNDIDKAAANTNKAGGGFKEFVSGATEAYNAWRVFSGAARTGLEMIDNINEMGTAAIRTAYAYEKLGGTADALEKMKQVTGGLVAETDIQRTAVIALSTNVVKTTADLEEFARIGSTLGVVLKNDATAGMTALAKILDSPGYTRELRNLGVDATAVKKAYKELREEMSDEDAWRTAVFEVAGKQADKMAEALTLTGSAVERTKAHFNELATTLSERVAVGLEAVVGWWEQLLKNPEVTLKVTLEQVALGAVSDDNATLNTLRGPYQQIPGLYGPGSKPPMGAWQDYYNMTHPQEPWSPPGPEGPGSNPQPFVPWRSVAMRNQQDTTADIGALKGRIATDDIREALSLWNRGLQSLLGIKDVFSSINNTAGDYKQKLDGMLAPLEKQQEILERRKAIQSIDQAFGIQQDGLYAEIGGRMQQGLDAVTQQLEKRAEEMRKKYGARSKQYKEALSDISEFENSGKEALDQYAIATGAATKESVFFRDQLDSVQQAFENGEITVQQYKNELLLLGEAAKQGATSMADLLAIQRRINLDLRPGAKSAADKSLFDQYARGVPGSAGGAAGDKETKPFDNVITGAREADKAISDVGMKSALAMAALTTGGALAASQLSAIARQGGDAVDVIDRLHQTLNTLASLTINITATTQPAGGSRDTTPARGPR